MSMFSDLNKIKGDRRPKKSNTKQGSLTDNLSARERRLQQDLTQENVRYVDQRPNTKNKSIFNRKMSEKAVRIELFLIEEDEMFMSQSLRKRMSSIIQVCTDELKTLYYEKGINNELPKNWEQFKEMIIEFCIGETIENIRKYKDELWSEYIQRLKEWSEKRDISEESVLQKLRNMEAPLKYQMIFNSYGISLEEVIARMRENEKIKDFTNTNENKKIKKTDKIIKCYNCGEKGI